MPQATPYYWPHSQVVAGQFHGEFPPSRVVNYKYISSRITAHGTSVPTTRPLTGQSSHRVQGIPKNNTTQTALVDTCILNQIPLSASTRPPFQSTLK